MRLTALLPLPLVIAVGACASPACSLVKTGGSPILELEFIAPGDGGPVTLLRLYSGAYRDPAVAVVEMEPLGQHRRCRKVVGPGIRELKAQLAGSRFETLFNAELEKGNDLGIHEAGLGVRWREGVVQRRLADVTPEFVEALKPVEKLFRGEFPSMATRYLPFDLGEVEHRELTPDRASAPDSFAAGEAASRSTPGIRP